MFKKLWQDYRKLSNADGKWVTVCALIYITFLLLDAYNPGTISSAILKYVGIFICVAYAYSKNHRDTALTLAILFTLLADTFLVWTTHEIIGVVCFCLAQFIHLARFKKKNQRYFGLCLVLGFLAIIFFYHGTTEILYIAAMFYAILLLTNFVFSAKKYFKPNSTVHDRFGFYGFCLFVCCDICVGFRHIMMDGIVSDMSLPIINFLIWFFYFPSQVFIASSSNIKTEPKSKKKAVIQ